MNRTMHAIVFLNREGYILNPTLEDLARLQLDRDQNVFGDDHVAKIMTSLKPIGRFVSADNKAREAAEKFMHYANGYFIKGDVVLIGNVEHIAAFSPWVNGEITVKYIDRVLDHSEHKFDYSLFGIHVNHLDNDTTTVLKIGHKVNAPVEKLLNDVINLRDMDALVEFQESITSVKGNP